MLKNVVSVLVLATTVAIAAVAVRADVPGWTPTSAGNGVGEELILVVADQLPTAEDVIRAIRRAGRKLSDVEGFYPARANDFAVTGVHLQTNPDVLSIGCPTVGGLVNAVVDGMREELECPANSKIVRLLRPIELRFVPKALFRTLTPVACGTSVTPPCQLTRYRALLGIAGGFRRGAHLAVAAFRTRQGATEFLDLARRVGLSGLVTVSARKLGGGDVGLGQEAHPDGSGPLLGPLPNQTSYQR